MRAKTGFAGASKASGWVLALSVLGSWVPAAGEDLSALEFRQVTDGRIAEEGIPVPRDAVRVFAYEGAPKEVGVSGNHIAVDYGLTGCLFDRKTGELTRRFSTAEGWPETRPDGFPAASDERVRLVGPGIIESRRAGPDETTAPEVAAEIEYRGETWRALQPKDFLHSLSRDMDWSERRERLNGWTPILEMLSRRSFVERGGAAPGEGRKYTMEDGLAGNIVTGLAVADGKLWASCVDIHDPAKKEWGPGGLCCYDEKEDRWERVDEIDGRPVRFVTLLQTIGDELWIGFREGTGVEGDSIVYGMGLYVGDYRPTTKAVVLASLKDGKWTVYSRPPRQDPPVSRFRGPEQEPPTEAPEQVAVSGEKAILFSRIRSVERSYSYDPKHDGLVSLCSLLTGEWRIFDLYQDFDADQLFDMVAENGEILMTGNRGVHQWLPEKEEWRFLDPECALKNPSVAAVEPAGDELWVGYGRERFGVFGEQGISRFDERKVEWSWMSPVELGTACPMKRMAVLPDGAVWALFSSQRDTMAAREEYPFYPREMESPRPEGIGVYKDGKWTFPMNLPDIPRSREYRWPGREGEVHSATQPLPMSDLIRVGEHLFLCNPLGIYTGPEVWKQIVSFPVPPGGGFTEGPSVLLEPSRDEEALLITLPDLAAPPDQRKANRARYVPGDSEAAFETITMDEDWYVIVSRGGFYRDGDSFQGTWARLPAAKEGDWVFGPFRGSRENRKRVIETSHAVWIVMPGQLVRLDRTTLSEWFGNNAGTD